MKSVNEEDDIVWRNRTRAIRKRLAFNREDDDKASTSYVGIYLRNTVIEDFSNRI